MKPKIIEIISSIIKICDTFVCDEFKLLILFPSQRPNTRYKTKKNEKRKTLNKILIKKTFITHSSC